MFTIDNTRKKALRARVVRYLLGQSFTALAHPRFKNWGSVCMESVHKRGTGACRDAKRLARNLRCNLVQSGAFWQEIDSSPVLYLCERKTLP